MSGLNVNDTIFALATGFIKAGIAVIRISGDKSRYVAEKMCDISEFSANKAVFCRIKDPKNSKTLDKGVAVFFASPHSYTGEDILELQIHGGKAVISAVLNSLAKIDGLRPATGGEFTRRAVLNGKMDLTSAEGISDLINAETEEQRKQAFRQMNGGLFKLYDGWKNRLTRSLAHLEAYIDFPEEDIPEDTELSISNEIRDVLKEIEEHLSDNHRGELLRNGYNIAIIGEPNAGKSSLLNKLVKRDVAIVSEIAGTTRDIIEAYIDVDGFPVIFSDTAGLRETSGEIEAEGIRRALSRAENADMILAIFDGNKYPILNEETLKLANLAGHNSLKVINKIDNIKEIITDTEYLGISVKTGEGLDNLWKEISKKVRNKLEILPHPALTNARHRQALEECCKNLHRSIIAPTTDLRAEDLRLSVRSLGNITGQVDIEDILDIVFKDFCIGK